MKIFASLLLVLALSSLPFSFAWDSTELDLYDLVEEIGQSFYDFLNISKDADSTTVRQAYRRLSRILHPDKNKDANAEIQFRNLVSVYEVLKDTEKRQLYDDVLQNGLPDWRSATFYYRRMRKMTVFESFTVLLVSLAIGQYLFAWAVYFEQLLNQTVPKKAKRNEKKGTKSDRKSTAVVNETVVEKPKVFDTFLIQLPKFCWFFVIVQIPLLVQAIKEARKQPVIEREPVEINAEESIAVAPRKRKVVVVAAAPVMAVEKTTNDELENEPETRKVRKKISKEPRAVSGGFWTDDDLADLVRLVNKYPGGLPDRWQTIAEKMSRSVNEVIFMANKLKDQQTDKECDPAIENGETDAAVREKIKTRVSVDEKTVSLHTVWTQVQQKALEKALVSFPKTVPDRWDKIANCVPDKTKEDCIYRHKYLVEKIKSQKS